jgi:hypothetical protein
MPYNGSGTFTRIYNWVSDAANGIKIRADRMDAEFDGIATGLSTALTKDGQTTPTANIPMGTFKITGLGNATTGTDALNRSSGDARYGQLAAANAFTTTNTFAVGIGNCGSSALSNTNVGLNTLQANTTGTNNTVLGYAALPANTTGTSNTAVGYATMLVNTTGNSNTAVGTSTLQANTTGATNTAVGTGALQANTTGTSNTAVGTSALLANTTANSNTAVGVSALQANTTGTLNVAVGSGALAANTTADDNTAVGMNALAANTTGTNNTATGRAALAANTTGASNTATGRSALLSNTTGSNNTASGASALSALTTETNCSGLGNSAAITGSNQVQLGDSATTTYVYGTVQNRSDARDKADIRDTKLGLDFVNSLRPVDYRYDMRDSYKPAMPAKPDADATPEQVEAHKAEMAEWLEAVKLKNITHDGSKKRSRYHSGIIAQELSAAIDASGFDAKGWGALQDHSVSGGDDVLSVGYDQFVAPLIKAIQELSAKVEKLESAANGGAK